ncbi:MAG: ABC transporter ATP-binding protein [Acidithiobacillales bacterium]
MIRFEAFGKLYDGRRAVEGLTLSVEAGEVVALLGPNGSGKTTSLKAAAGLVRPTAGRVLVGAAGIPLRSADEPAARAVLSYLPQRVSFPDALTGREVLEFYRKLRAVPAARVAEALHLASLNGAASRSVGSFSGGMVQRLGLAVAVLPDAPLLLLDEPTAALDPDGLCAFYGLVEARRREGKTVFFSSHQLGDVERLADRIAVLVEGRLVATLTAGELAARLAERGVMRLRISAPRAGLVEKVRAVAPGSSWRDEELIVPGPARRRPAVLDTIRAAGVEFTGLTAEEGRLEELYRELVEEHS